MLGTVFRRSASTAGAGVVHPAVAGMRLEAERDARGFQLGVLVPRHGSDATIAVRIADCTTMTPARVAAWYDAVSADETVVATCASRTSYGDYTAGALWVTFAADGKTERKETSEFLTRLACSVPAIYDAADAHGMDAHPVSPEQLAGWVSTELGGPGDETEFPPRVRVVHEQSEALLVDDHVSISFEVYGHDDQEDVFAAVSAIGQELSVAANGALTVRVGAWRRAVVDPDESPRRFGVVSLIAESKTEADDAARLLVAALPARQRLRLRRMWHRQAMAAGASLGAGALGWQRLEVSP